MLGAHLDVTELKAAEAARAEAEAWLRLALSAAALGVIEWDLEDGVLRADAGAEAVSRGALPAGRPLRLGGPERAAWRACIHPDDLPRREAARAAIEAGREAAVQDQFRIRVPGDAAEAWAWISIRTAAVARDGATGRATRVLDLVQDVTPRRAAEAALRESEARFRTTMDTAPAIVWVTDSEGRCTFLNRRWYDFTGQSEAEALGLGWLDATHPADREAAGRVFLDAAARRAAFRLEYRLRRADGTYIWAIDAGEPRLGADGAFLGHVGAVFDISDRREAEERQRLLLRELDHRVKNTLSVVQSLAQQTQRATAEEPHRFYADFAPRLRALAGAHDVLTREGWRGAPLGETLRRTLAAHEGPLAEEGTPPRRVTLEGPDLLLTPSAVVGLSMVFNELATNAAKYGALSAPGGRVAVRWRVEGEAAEAGGGPPPPSLHLEWIERGGPAPGRSATARRGFGMRLIEAVVVRELAGRQQRQAGPEGMEVRFTMPLGPRLVAGSEGDS
jgi:PAS domain S-box-containing protein